MLYTILRLKIMDAPCECIDTVTTLHQDSETASKPNFFRGPHWGCVSLLVPSGDKRCVTPLWAAIHQGLEQVGGRDTPSGTLSTRIVTMARTIAQTLHRKAYLVLDAFFAVGPVFQEASKEIHGERNGIHILTRAEKNIVAYRPYTRTRKPSRGRPVKYWLYDFPLHIWSQSRCWLRTYSSDTPVAFVTRTALANVIRGNLYAFRKDRITQIIFDKQHSSMNPALQRKVA